MTENKNQNKSKGYNKRNNHYSKPSPAASALPPAELLEAYDYVVEGSAARILSMFEAEQKHRHDWEAKALKTHMVSTVLGQILGFMIALSIFGSAIVIGLYGDSNTAAFIWVFGLAIVVMAGLVWSYAKSMGQRPLFARPAMRQNFRPEK